MYNRGRIVIFLKVYMPNMESLTLVDYVQPYTRPTVVEMDCKMKGARQIKNPYKKTRCSIPCCRPAFFIIFYPATCLYFNVQACENPMALLPYRIVAGYFACAIVYLQQACVSLLPNM